MPAPATLASRLAADRRWKGPAAAVALSTAASVALLAWQHHETSVAPPKAAPDRPGLQRPPARPEDNVARPSEARTLLPPDAAQLANAAIPFAGTPLALAKPFVFRGSDADRARAVECLATAVLYEAGDDRPGEAAVAQVVLNRVRHPAFPATVCGVVYQGAERSTGCQFTFTCDGSLARRPSEAAWERARAIATEALGGKVEPSVGLATHYHTDWVYPYWSPSLRKLAQVGTHLFFTWPGAWGEPRAFVETYRGGEPPARPAVSASPAPSAEPAIAAQPLGGSEPVRSLSGKAVPLYGTRVAVSDPAAGRFALAAGADASAAKLVNAALALCQEPGYCRVEAWPDGTAIPSSLPAPRATANTAVFLFERDPAQGPATIRFDCRRFPNRNAGLCL